MDVVTLSAGTLSALIAGATGSLHCALMCGPLACAGLPATGVERRWAASSWHLGRLLAYSAMGFLLGALGRSVAFTFTLSVQPVLPWLMAAGLIITAFDLTKKVPAVPGLSSISRTLARVGAPRSAPVRSFWLGAATPFLPCGLLYGLFLAALATGSPLGGAGLLGAFAFGSLPALGAVQLGTSQLHRFPKLSKWARRGIPLLAALILIARAIVLQSADVAQCG